jgi:hypothetical protein
MLLGEGFQTFHRKVKPSFSRVKWTKKKCPSRLQSGDTWARSDQLSANGKDEKPVCRCGGGKMYRHKRP